MRGRSPDKKIQELLKKQADKVDAVSDILSGGIDNVDDSEVDELLKQIGDETPQGIPEEEEKSLEQLEEDFKETLEEEEEDLQKELKELEELAELEIENEKKEERSLEFKHESVLKDSPAAFKPSENNLLTQAQALQEKAKELTDHQTKKIDHLVEQHKSRADALKDDKTREALKQPTARRHLFAEFLEKCMQFLAKVKSFFGIKDHTKPLDDRIQHTKEAIEQLEKSKVRIEKSLQNLKNNPNKNNKILVQRQEKQLANLEKLEKQLLKTQRLQQLPTLKRK